MTNWLIWEMVVNVIDTAAVLLLIIHQLKIDKSRFKLLFLIAAIDLVMVGILQATNVNLSLMLPGGVTIYLNRMQFVAFLLILTNLTSSRSFSENLMWSCIPPLVTVVADYIALGILENMTGYSVVELLQFGELRVVTTSLYLGLVCVIYLVLIILGKQRSRRALSLPIHLRFLLVVILLFGIIAIDQIIDFSFYTDNFSSDEYQGKTRFVAVAFFIILLSSIILIQQIGGVMRDLMNAQQEKLVLQNYQELERSYYALRKTKHDIKNHFQTMRGLLSAKQYDQLEAYFGDMSGEYYETDTILTGNIPINVLLTSKLAQAEEQGITVTHEIGGLENLSERSAEISSVIGNLMDNAIEACCRMKAEEKRYIHLEIEQRKNMLLVEIKNSSDGEYLSDGPEFLTRKRDSSHGMGLKIVENIIQKYGGYTDVTPGQDSFSVRVFLPTDQFVRQSAKGETE